MNMTRREMLGLLGTGSAAMALGGCACPPPPNTPADSKHAKIALQLYSIRAYIDRVGLDRALEDIASMGYSGIEIAWWCLKTPYSSDPKGLRKALANVGLKACGAHVGTNDYGFDAAKGTDYNSDAMKKLCEFSLAYGNNLLICPGGGNIPPGCKWSTGQGGDVCQPTKEIDEFTKRLADLYNKAAADAAKFGCRIGLHNHTWEHAVRMTDGTSFWDYFFSNTDPAVCMEQDVGWTTCVGVDPCEQYAKYPHRSPTLHAKENGMGKGVKRFDAILGKPGEPGATPVDWDRLIAATEKDRVDWYVVECERHGEDLSAVLPSYGFLRAKGLR